MVNGGARRADGWRARPLVASDMTLLFEQPADPGSAGVKGLDGDSRRRRSGQPGRTSGTRAAAARRDRVAASRRRPARASTPTAATSTAAPTGRGPLADIGKRSLGEPGAPCSAARAGSVGLAASSAAGLATSVGDEGWTARSLALGYGLGGLSDGVTREARTTSPGPLAAGEEPVP